VTLGHWHYRCNH